MNETLAQLLPELATPPAPAEEVQPAAEIPPTVEDSVPETPVPLSAREELLSLIISGSDAGAGALAWNTALTDTVNFLDLADLPAIQTVDRLRGQKEANIRDKVQCANSVLVLLANYGSDTDNAALVAACETYADKMKTIIKRLCL